MPQTSEMVELEFSSQYKDQLKLFGKDWSVPNPKAVLLLIPGYGDHCQRYEYLRIYFNEHSVSVVGVDLRGQGRSGGERGYSPSVDAYIDDLMSGINMVLKRYPNVPFFLHGDGIGAAIAILYIVQGYTKPSALAGLIALTPSIAFPKDPNFFQRGLIRAFAFLAPHFRAPVLGGDYEYTDNKEAIEARDKDKLYHDRWPAQTAGILCDAAMYFQKMTFDFQTPTLVQHGSKAFLPMQKVRDWVNKCKGNIKLKEWDGFHAEIHNDLARDQVFEYTLKWMEEQIEEINKKST